MMEIIKALITGGVVGLVFGLMKLPIPAPSAWAGIAGIVGIFVGYLLSKYLQ